MSSAVAPSESTVQDCDGPLPPSVCWHLQRLLGVAHGSHWQQRARFLLLLPVGSHSNRRHARCCQWAPSALRKNTPCLLLTLRMSLMAEGRGVRHLIQ